MAKIPLRRCLPALICLAPVACRPELPLPDQRQGPPAADVEVTVTAEPAAPLDAIPRVVRLHLAAAGVELDPGEVVLIAGKASAAHLREIQRGEISRALAERIVPALLFPDEGAAGAVLAPTVALDAGARYTLAIASPGTLVDLDVVVGNQPPMLERVWPIAGRSATSGVGVWCGAVALPTIDAPVSLDPDGVKGWLRRGASAEDLGERCLRFEAPAIDAKDGGVPPPALPVVEVTMLLDPRPLAVDAAPEPIARLPCARNERAFGPACVRVFDDRLLGRAPEAPAFWRVFGAGVDRAFSTNSSDPFVISGLAPEHAIALSVDAIDNRGVSLHTIFSATTLPPMPHLVLNEVLANPIGPEPAQEWVEIVNDGAATAELDGYVLVDVGGETVLPPGKLEPGRFALIVNASFVEDDDYDPAPAPDAIIVRVPKLGKGGLSNSGEPLKLRAPGGAVVSRFPGMRGSKAGMSLARRDPAVPDAIPEGFLSGSPTPGRANGP